jgi:hypothetical protein
MLVRNMHIACYGREAVRNGLSRRHRSCVGACEVGSSAKRASVENGEVLAKGKPRKTALTAADVEGGPVSLEPSLPSS